MCPIRQAANTGPTLQINLQKGSEFPEFAREVQSLNDLDPSIRQRIAEKLLPGEPVCRILIAPRQRHIDEDRLRWAWLTRWLFWLSTPDWVVLLTPQRVLVAVVQPEKLPTVTATCIADILSMEWGTVLLFSWIEWSWAEAGRVQRMRIYFNSVGECYFQDLLATLRRVLIEFSGYPPPSGERHLEYYDGLHFKYMNLIPRRYLLPDEEAQAVVFRPAIKSQRLGLFHVQTAPEMVLVLTNYHLALVQEEQAGGFDRYGLIARYYPRRYIEALHLEQDAGRLWLCAELERGGVKEDLRIAFDLPAEAGLQRLIAHFSS